MVKHLFNTQKIVENRVRPSRVKAWLGSLTKNDLMKEFLFLQLQQNGEKIDHHLAVNQIDSIKKNPDFKDGEGSVITMVYGIQHLDDRTPRELIKIIETASMEK